MINIQTLWRGIFRIDRLALFAGRSDQVGLTTMPKMMVTPTIQTVPAPSEASVPAPSEASVPAPSEASGERLERSSLGGSTPIMDFLL